MTQRLKQNWKCLAVTLGLLASFAVFGLLCPANGFIVQQGSGWSSAVTTTPIYVPPFASRYYPPSDQTQWSTGRVVDVTGNGNHGTMGAGATQKPTWTNIHERTAWYCDGVDDLLNPGGWGSGAIYTQGFTVAFWDLMPVDASSRIIGNTNTWAGATDGQILNSYTDDRFECYHCNLTYTTPVNSHRCGVTLHHWGFVAFAYSNGYGRVYYGTNGMSGVSRTAQQGPKNVVSPSVWLNGYVQKSYRKTFIANLAIGRWASSNEIAAFFLATTNAVGQ